MSRRHPVARLGRIRSTGDGRRSAKCTCGWTFEAPTDAMLLECWSRHVDSEAWLHREKPLVIPRDHPAATAPPSLLAHIGATVEPCQHRNAIAVEDLLGEVVAMLCPDCDEQLVAEWRTEQA